MPTRALVAALALLLALPAPARADDGFGLVDADGRWRLLGRDGTVHEFLYGNPADVPFAGDWDCDGIDTPGLFRRTDGFVYLRNSNTTGVADLEFFFGNPGDVPLAGDFDGDGCDTVSLYRPAEGRVFVIDRLGSRAAGLGAADHSYYFGNPGDAPFVGDFDGDGVDTVGLHRATTGLVYQLDAHRAGLPDRTFVYGDPDDALVAGDWDGDGAASPAVFRPADELFYATDRNAAGAAGTVVGLCAGRGGPVAGDFGLPAAGNHSWLPVDVLVGAAEQAALGDGDLAVGWPGGGTRLGVGGRRLLLPAGGTVTFAYLTPAGAPTGVCWRQVVPAGGSMIAQQPWRTGARGDGSIVLAWQATGDTPRYVAQLDAAPGLTVTSPVWWHVTAAGGLTGQGDQALVDAARARGIEVWPAIASLDAGRTRAALSDPARRRALAQEVSARAQRVGATGVNIDIEGFHVPDAPLVTAFARDLTAAVHGWGGVTSFDLTVRSDTWQLTVAEGPFWSTAPDRRALAEAVDYVILMAYDQHNRVRPAGPVADQPWVEDALRYLLRYADPAQVILGVPFYGRVWDPADLARPRAVGMAALADLVASGTRTADPNFAVDRVDLPDGRFTWAELPDGLAARRDLVGRYGLAGIAAWRLGFDSPAVWGHVAPAREESASVRPRRRRSSFLRRAMRRLIARIRPWRMSLRILMRIATHPLGSPPPPAGGWIATVIAAHWSVDGSAHPAVPVGPAAACAASDAAVTTASPV